MNEAALSQIALAVVAGIVTIVVKWLDGRSNKKQADLQPEPEDSSSDAETFNDDNEEGL